MIQRWGLLLGALAMLCSEAWTQGESEGDLASDRPSESAAASLLPSGFGRAEIGGRMTWLTDAESGAQTFSYAAPLGVLRYGINEWVELRVGARFSGSVGAVDDAMLGAKLRLPGGFWGETKACYLVEANMDPSRGRGVNLKVPSAHRICVGTTISHHWSLTGNAGWLRDSGMSSWMGSLAVGRELGVQGWSGFVEPYLYSGAPLRINAGFQRQLPEEMQADICLGRNLTGPETQFEVNIGFTWTLARP